MVQRKIKKGYEPKVFLRLTYPFNYRILSLLIQHMNRMASHQCSSLRTKPALS